MALIEQGMAATAARLLPDAGEASDNIAELRSRFRQLPSQLHNGGLAATYAFLAARSGSSSSPQLSEAYRNVARQIRVHLADRGMVAARLGTDPEPGVHRTTLAALGEMDPQAYALAAREVSLLFTWLRRLSDAVYSQTGGNGAREPGGEEAT